MAKRKPKKRQLDPAELEAQLAQYDEVWGEVAHFIELIARQETEIAEAQQKVIETKEKYDTARAVLDDARQARDGTKHALFMFLRPGPNEIMPLFDRMEWADEEKHGAHADEWRKEPITALNLSLIATNHLTAADVLFVGQLQDRTQARPDDWFKEIDGISAPMAAAIADRLNDFINERTSK